MGFPIVFSPHIKNRANDGTKNKKITGDRSQRRSLLGCRPCIRSPRQPGSRYQWCHSVSRPLQMSHETDYPKCHRSVGCKALVREARGPRSTRRQEQDSVNPDHLLQVQLQPASEQLGELLDAHRGRCWSLRSRRSGSPYGDRVARGSKLAASVPGLVCGIPDDGRIGRRLFHQQYASMNGIPHRKSREDE